MVKLNHRIHQHMMCLGFTPLQSQRFSDDICRWVKANGPEWTVERLKDLKQAYRASLASGADLIVPRGWAKRSNFAGRKLLKSAFLHQLLSTTHTTEAKLRKVEGLFRTTTLLKFNTGETSDKQRKKMTEAITGRDISDRSFLKEAVDCKNNLLRLRKAPQKVYQNTLRAGNDVKILADMLGSDKRSPRFQSDYKGRLSYCKSVSRSSIEAGDWEDYFQCDRKTNEYWRNYPDVVAMQLLGVGLYPHSYCLDGMSDAPAGTLTVIQEGACKARWVANPLLAFQALGEPLKKRLQYYTEQLYSEVRVKNQDSGRETVAGWLAQGRTVWCYDATSFTDRFPLALQRKVLSLLLKQGAITESDVDAFDLVIGKDWLLEGATSIAWSVGQPLGYGPSFPLANLTHAILLGNMTTKSDSWLVVGDDVVISDAELAVQYQDIMLKFGVQLNPAKAMISAKYAEFLGKLITPAGVTPSMKVKFLMSPDQIQDNLLFYGRQALKHLTIEELFDAQGVFLPLELGGLDWKLEDISYTDWIIITNQVRWSQLKLGKDLRQFVGEPKECQESLELGYQSWLDFLARNTIPLSDQEWALGGYLNVNGIANLPTCKSSGRQVPKLTGRAAIRASYLQPEWSRMVDVASSLEGEEDIHAIFNKDGYISDSEKPFDGQSQPHGIVQHGKPSKRTPRVFSWREAYHLYHQGELSAKTKEELKRLFQGKAATSPTNQRGNPNGQV